MTPVVLMAGGRGMRLHPLTLKKPKPMVNVGGKPILEQIIDGFSRQGFKRFWLAVNYKAELIVEYFGNGSAKGLKIKYLHEDQPMGTGGALRMLPPFEIPFIVQNGDVLTRLSYGDLMEHHARSNADITVCVALWQYQLPYGVADFEDEEFIGLREKPIEASYVNAGIYVIEPRAMDYAPEGRFDMPDLVERVETRAAYPIEDYWCDVGRFEDLGRANGEFEA